VIIWVAMLIIHFVLGRLGWVSGVVSAVVGLAYMFTEVMNAASPGKMILGLVIGTVDGASAPQDVLLKRYLIKNAGNLIGLVAAILAIPIIHSLLVLVGALVGLGLAFASLYLVLRPEKLALWDQMAGTAVFRSAELGAVAPVMPPVAPMAGESMAPPPPPPVAPAPEA
jgi:hypothetical protein